MHVLLSPSDFICSSIPFMHWHIDMGMKSCEFGALLLFWFWDEPSLLACSQGMEVLESDHMHAHAQLVRFEAFRDLVKLLQLGVAEEAGILLAEDENLDARAAAKSSAAAQAAVSGGQAAGPKAPGVAAGTAPLADPRLLYDWVDAYVPAEAGGSAVK